MTEKPNITNNIEGSGFSAIFKGIQKDYTNSSKKIIKGPLGKLPINSLTIVRTPIQAVIAKVLNILSWNKYKFDDLYHLAMIAKIGNKQIVIEKNERINISTSYKISDKTEYFDIKLNNLITLEQLLNNTLTKYGNSKYFLYDGLNNNCQDFLMMILTANNLNNSQAITFIKQNLTQLKKKIPKYLPKVMNFVTDVGAKTSEILGGCDNCKADTHKEKLKKIRKILDTDDNYGGKLSYDDEMKKKREEQLQFQKKNNLLGKKLNTTENKNNEGFMKQRRQDKDYAKAYHEALRYWLSSEYGFNPKKTNTDDFIKYLEKRLDAGFNWKKEPATEESKYNFSFKFEPIHENPWERITDVTKMDQIIDGAADAANFLLGKKIVPRLSSTIKDIYNLGEKGLSREDRQAIANEEIAKRDAEEEQEQEQEGAGLQPKKMLLKQIKQNIKKYHPHPAITNKNKKQLLQILNDLERNM
jgi:hypothetical protein